MQNKFRQPVSMQVTKEQYEEDLREPLLRMGYLECALVEWETAAILVTNYGNTGFYISNTINEYKKKHNRYFIPKYNPKLFLAIAAMSNEQYGIYGEWWYCLKDVKMEGSGKVEYNKGKLYMGMDNERIVDNSGLEDHYWRDFDDDDYDDDNRAEYFRKATLQELITNFTEQKQENIMKEITTELIEELKKLITPENEEQFNKLMGIEKPMFKKEDFRFGDKVIVRRGDITFTIIKWKTENGDTEEFGLFGKLGAIRASKYDYNLLDTENELGDIMKIYRPKGNFIPYDLANNCLDDYELIWSRE